MSKKKETHYFYNGVRFTIPAVDMQLEAMHRGKPATNRPRNEEPQDLGDYVRTKADQHYDA